MTRRSVSHDAAKRNGSSYYINDSERRDCDSRDSERPLDELVNEGLVRMSDVIPVDLQGHPQYQNIHPRPSSVLEETGYHRTTPELDKRASKKLGGESIRKYSY
jgi:hypothetical protein